MEAEYAKQREVVKAAVKERGVEVRSQAVRCCWAQVDGSMHGHTATGPASLLPSPMLHPWAACTTRGFFPCQPRAVASLHLFSVLHLLISRWVWTAPWRPSRRRWRAQTWRGPQKPACKKGTCSQSLYVAGLHLLAVAVCCRMHLLAFSLCCRMHLFAANGVACRCAGGCGDCTGLNESSPVLPLSTSLLPASIRLLECCRCR